MKPGEGRRQRSRAWAALVVVLSLLTLGAAPDDPLVDRQYHLRTVHAFRSWDVGRGAGIVVAVVDTGVDGAHPDLRGRLVGGVDLVDRGTAPDDPNGHGTLVAGIVAATAGNGEGGAGGAPDAAIMPVRVLDATGEGSSDVVAEGIRWAADHGAHIINLSLAEVAGQQQSPSALITRDVEFAIRQAALKGVLVVAAAGNDGADRTPYAEGVPALVVGATDARDRVWVESNRDEDTLFAPGVGIVSTYRGGYAVADGTSFAAPVVAAGGALLRARGLSSAAARERLVDTARPIGTGVGRVDYAAALGITRAPQPSPTPQSSPAPAPTPPPEATPSPRRAPSPLPAPRAGTGRRRAVPRPGHAAPRGAAPRRRGDPGRVAAGRRPRPRRRCGWTRGCSGPGPGQRATAGRRGWRIGVGRGATQGRARAVGARRPAAAKRRQAAVRAAPQLPAAPPDRTGRRRLLAVAAMLLALDVLALASYVSARPPER